MRLSVNPLRKSGLLQICPAQNASRSSCRSGLPDMFNSSAKLPADVTNALLRISPATIDRILKTIRINHTKRGRSTTKPGTLLRKQIPIKTNQWDELRPGFLEADTVAHCGDSTSGMYVNTIDFVDIATGWTEQRAVWGKGESGVLEQLKKPSRFPSSDSIVITEVNSSTITS